MKIILRVAARDFALSRRIYRLVHKSDFQQKYKECAEQFHVIQLVENRDHRELKKWYYKQTVKDLYSLTVKQLRQLCPCYGLKDYENWTKCQLIERIRDERKNLILTRPNGETDNSS